GAPVRDHSDLNRIKALAIPPAWTDVWICPSPRGHIQATGRDAKGRKQYRYHAKWNAARDETKYTRMLDFGRALPAIRAHVETDLSKPGMPREKVLAAVVRLLETTLVRVGNQEYAKSNRSYGLTTLRDKHVAIEGATMRFQFRGKSGVEHEVDVRDRRIAKIVKRCQELPGQELFQYVDDTGDRQSVGSGDVNDYLREITGKEFTAKDVRTWAGTVLAAQALRDFDAFDSEAQAKRNIVNAIEAVASRLGNTSAVCRKCYVHPAVLDAYLTGGTIATIQERADEELANDLAELPPEEAAVLVLLRANLVREAASRA
ncbi:MAG: DNA topoisomerase IB, partial [Chloroflexota bacterium]|nr:DNA topoisomerase IB [Chloroflexota bacterium]